MKYILFLTLLAVSCKTNLPNQTVLSDVKSEQSSQTSFTKIPNSDSSFILNYKVEKKVNDPVKIYTYYISESKTGKILRPTEQIAAEKIYWKDNSTLAIIPYIEVMPKDDGVGEPKSNEILIQIQ